MSELASIPYSKVNLVWSTFILGKRPNKILVFDGIRSQSVGFNIGLMGGAGDWFINLTDPVQAKMWLLR